MVFVFPTVSQILVSSLANKAGDTWSISNCTLSTPTALFLGISRMARLIRHLNCRLSTLKFLACIVSCLFCFIPMYFVNSAGFSCCPVLMASACRRALSLWSLFMDRDCSVNPASFILALVLSASCALACLISFRVKLCCAASCAWRSDAIVQRSPSFHRFASSFALSQRLARYRRFCWEEPMALFHHNGFRGGRRCMILSHGVVINVSICL